MGKYTIRRSILALPLLLGIAAISFLFMQLAPGGPLTILAHNPHMTQAQLNNIKANLGLDKPGIVQFALWLGGLLHGDWGYSYVDGRPVLQVILERLPATMELMGAAFVIAFALAIPIGLLAALRQYSLFDYATTFFSFFALSMPVFWFGLMLQLFFAVRLGVLPSAGQYDSAANTVTLGDSLRHLILPALTLGITSIAGWSRYMRSSLLEVIHQDYIRTARAKGLPGRLIVLKHAVRNALIPLLTVIALDVPGYFVGAVVTETVFSWPGMGRLFVSSLEQRDYPVQMGLLVISAVLIIIGNLIADLAYGWLDPRVTYS
ncbi:MAG: ABC transporter permease [Chloroflexota bacterium]|nr:ABC transporter permease [Chloroflexota bacterium]